MNFNAPLLKPLRILLFPFSFIYAFIIIVRNFCFDHHWIPSTRFNFPIICVGNLAVGGTGKSTMVEYLLKFLNGRYQTAVLSRGYKRKTKGYALAHEKCTALEIGDEPMQFYLKFPSTAIAVGEKRVEAIPQLLQDKPSTELIILDDAFQHRSVKAGYNIILTEFNNLYSRDWFLPTGDLRDQRKSAARANIMVVTKSPQNLEIELANAIKVELKPLLHQEVFFSTLKYGTPYHIINNTETDISSVTEILLVTGIANPTHLKTYIHERVHSYEELLFSDHHIYTIDDWNEILNKFKSIAAPNKLMITTEKDAVRLLKFAQHLNDVPLYVIPVEMEILFGQTADFQNKILSYIQTYPKSIK